MILYQNHIDWQLCKDFTTGLPGLLGLQASRRNCLKPSCCYLFQYTWHGREYPSLEQYQPPVWKIECCPASHRGPQSPAAPRRSSGTGAAHPAGLSPSGSRWGSCRSVSHTKYGRLNFRKCIVSRALSGNSSPIDFLGGGSVRRSQDQACSLIIDA